MRLRADELTDALGRVADRTQSAAAAPEPGGLTDVRRRARRQTGRRRRRTGLAVAAVVILAGGIGVSAAWRSSGQQRIEVPADDPTTAPVPPIYTRSVPGGSITGAVVEPAQQLVLWGPYSDSGWHRRAPGCGPERLELVLRRDGQPDRTGYINWPVRQLTMTTEIVNGAGVPTWVPTFTVMAPLGFQQGDTSDAVHPDDPNTMAFIATGRTDGEHLRATFFDGAVDETIVSGGMAVFIGSETPAPGLAMDPWSTTIDLVAESGATTRIFAGFGAMADIPGVEGGPSGPCPELAIQPEVGRPADVDAATAAIDDTIAATFRSDAAPDAMTVNVLDATADLAPAFERTRRANWTLPAEPTTSTTRLDELHFVDPSTAWAQFSLLTTAADGTTIHAGGGWVHLQEVDGHWRITRESICGLGGTTQIDGWPAPDDPCTPPESTPTG